MDLDFTQLALIKRRFFRGRPNKRQVEASEDHQPRSLNLIWEGGRFFFILQAFFDKPPGIRRAKSRKCLAALLLSTFRGFVRTLRTLDRYTAASCGELDKQAVLYICQ